MSEKWDRFSKQWDHFGDVVIGLLAGGLGLYSFIQSGAAAHDQKYSEATYDLLVGVCCVVYFKVFRR